MKKDILIILPAYNEEATLPTVLGDILHSPLSQNADVLVINDGSKDNTAQVAWSMNALVTTHVYNMGYGSALQTGYKYAMRHGYRYVLQLDSDGQHDVGNLEYMINRLMDPSKEPVDILLGSRFLEGSKTFPVSKAKMYAINFFRSLIKMATGQVITDPTSGLQGLSERAFEYYSRYNNFHFEYPDTNMIIQMLLNDFKIEEYPAMMHPRVAGESMHSGFKPILYAFKMTLGTVIVVIREKATKHRHAKKSAHSEVAA